MNKKLEEILEITKELLNMIEDGFPLPDTEKYAKFFLCMKNREGLIKSLKDLNDARDRSEKMGTLHKIEKSETRLLGMLKKEFEELKKDIQTVSTGKKAVKNGYLNTYGKYTEKNRFSKRG
jgi:protein subunit release factor A